MQKISFLKQSEPVFFDNVKKTGTNGSFSGEGRDIEASFKEILSSDITKTRSTAASDAVTSIISNSSNIDTVNLQKQHTRLAKGGTSIVKHLLSREDLKQEEGFVDPKLQIRDGKIRVALRDDTVNVNAELKDLKTAKDVVLIENDINETVREGIDGGSTVDMLKNVAVQIHDGKIRVVLRDDTVNVNAELKDLKAAKDEVSTENDINETVGEDIDDSSTVGMLKNVAVQNEKSLLTGKTNVIVNDDKTGVIQKNHVGTLYDNKKAEINIKTNVKGSSPLSDTAFTNTTIPENRFINRRNAENHERGTLDVVAEEKKTDKSVVSKIVRPHVNFDYAKVEEQKPLVATEKRLTEMSDNKKAENQKSVIVNEEKLTKVKDGEIRTGEFVRNVVKEVAAQGNTSTNGTPVKIQERFSGKLNNDGSGVKSNKPKTEKIESVSKVINDVLSGKELQLDKEKVSMDGHRLEQSLTVSKKLNVNGEALNSTRNGAVRHSSMNPVEDSLSETDLSVNKLVPGDEIKDEARNAERNIKVEQKIVHVQNAKNELSGQNQRKNENEFVYQSNSLKNKKGKSEVVDAGSMSVNEKKLMSNKVQTTKMPVNVQNNVNSDLKSQFGDMVVRGAKQFIKGGSQEIHLTIRKPDLGNLKISFIERGKGGVDISIVAERADAVEVIKQNSGELKQLLLQDGIDLSKFDVFSENSRERGRLAYNDGFQRKHQRRQNVEEDTLSNFNDKDVERYTQEVQNRGLVAGNSQVNVFA